MPGGGVYNLRGVSHVSHSKHRYSEPGNRVQNYQIGLERALEACAHRILRFNLEDAFAAFRVAVTLGA